MKILHILDHSLPVHDGYSFRSQNIFQAQRDRGLQPVIVTSPKHEESWKGPWAKEEQVGGHRYYRTGAVSHNGIPFEAELRLMTALANRIQEVVERERPDVLLVKVFSHLTSKPPSIVLLLVGGGEMEDALQGTGETTPSSGQGNHAVFPDEKLSKSLPGIYPE